MIDFPDGSRIWIPPKGRPYWVTGPKCPSHSCGPSLTDEEMKLYFKKPSCNDT
jgi:hypothetical protein